MRLARSFVLAGALLAVGASAAGADTATFAYTGSEQTFTVPAGVTIEVTAIGAPGGTETSAPTSGRGAIVSGSLSVTPGQVLYVEVGGVGQSTGGGFNGGGNDGSFSRGGGGASDVRTLPGSDGTPSLDSRLIVAAGGGGNGLSYSGGDAGAQGSLPDCGGGAGTADTGGAGVNGGTSGSLGTGGDGYGGQDGGGGGGGGLYGGGGGGNTGCGGGGGSSKVPAGGTSGLAEIITPPQVQITYTAPPSDGGGSGGGGGSGAGGGTSGGGGGLADATRPLLRDLAMSRASFSAANTGPGFIAAVGTRVSYRLSEAASTRFTVERATRGRRRGRRCVKGRRGRRCTRYVRLRGSFTQTGTAGLNSFRFMGRLRGRALRRGKYRLVAVATDAAGNRSAPVRRAFRIR